MKERLTAYRRLMVEIDIAERRRDAIDPEAGYSARRARQAIERRLSKMLEKECREHDALTAIIDELPDAEQRQVLHARYIDGHAWCGIVQILYGRRFDFHLKAESYERRVYRIHGNALANANRIAAELGRGVDTHGKKARRPVRPFRRPRVCGRRAKVSRRAKGRFWAR